MTRNVLVGGKRTRRRRAAVAVTGLAGVAVLSAVLAQSANGALSRSQVGTAALTTPAQARTWGANGPATTLVLYDSTGSYGWLGELYAIGAGNLATHFGTVTAEPVLDYQRGQVNDYTATIYLGSTYNQPIPAGFLDDVLTTHKQVIWAAYGRDPATSYLDTTDTISSVSYKGQTFTRSVDDAGGVLAPHITRPGAVTTLASANCTDASGDATNCASIAQTTGTSFPWAIHPGNLEEFAAYLKSQGVPFTMAVIPRYLDPNGAYHNGVPESESLPRSAGMVAAIKEAVADGGTIDQIGYTHQYSNVDNPYNGVIETGPVPGDSQSWALNRVKTGRALFAQAGLPDPAIWTTPHYAASAADYAAIDRVYSVRYEDGLYFGGELTGGAIDYSHVFAQFFPYEVHDLYGDTVIPQNMDYYQPQALNNAPPHTTQDLVNEARLNTEVTQGVASFFIHPDYDPLSVLEQIVRGIKAEGYTFVSPRTLMADNG